MGLGTRSCQWRQQPASWQSLSVSLFFCSTLMFRVADGCQICHIANVELQIFFQGGSVASRTNRRAIGSVLACFVAVLELQASTNKVLLLRTSSLPSACTGMLATIGAGRHSGAGVQEQCRVRQRTHRTTQSPSSAATTTYESRPANLPRFRSRQPMAIARQSKVIFGTWSC